MYGGRMRWSRGWHACASWVPTSSKNIIYLRTLDRTNPSRFSCRGNNLPNTSIGVTSERLRIVRPVLWV